MSETTTASDQTPREAARTLILERLGPDNVAEWCGVAKNTVFQWLSRGTDDQPVPLRQAMTIWTEARRLGIDFKIQVIAPSVPEGVA